MDRGAVLSTLLLSGHHAGSFLRAGFFLQSNPFSLTFKKVKMPNEKFTPGRLSKGANGNIFSKDHPGMLVATCHKDYYANLIAAAPDMYEALKKALLLLEPGEDTYEMVAAALSKANPQI